MESHSIADSAEALAVSCIVCDSPPYEPCYVRPFGIVCSPHNARKRDAGRASAVEFSATRFGVAAAAGAAVAGAENRRAPRDDDQLCLSGRSAQLYCTTSNSF